MTYVHLAIPFRIHADQFTILAIRFMFEPVSRLLRLNRLSRTPLFRAPRFVCFLLLWVLGCISGFMCALHIFGQN